MKPPERALAPIVTRLRRAGCVFAEEEARLLVEHPVDDVERERLVARRIAGEPLEHLLGWVELCGTRFAVHPGVFVPRRRTELMVRTAVGLAPDRPVVVDLCCGSGAIGAAVADEVPGTTLHAADLDPVAVRNARRNVEPRGGQVHLGDLYDALPRALRGRVDLLLVNAPYVPTEAIAEMPPEARDHEPATALDGGSDGLDVHRRVARDAHRWLGAGGHLLIETGSDQEDPACALFVASGLQPWLERAEESGATVVVGRRA